MELRSVEFSPIEDGIRLKLRIIVESGTFATIYKPDKVYISVSGESIQASDFGGFFGTGSAIGQLKMGGKGDTADGWIEFVEVLNKIAAANCFEFHYGKYYSFTGICIKR